MLVGQFNHFEFHLLRHLINAVNSRWDSKRGERCLNVRKADRDARVSECRGTYAGAEMMSATDFG